MSTLDEIEARNTPRPWEAGTGGRETITFTKGQYGFSLIKALTAAQADTLALTRALRVVLAECTRSEAHPGLLIHADYLREAIAAALNTA